MVNMHSLLSLEVAKTIAVDRRQAARRRPGALIDPRGKPAAGS
jgi:hypothetical protein